MRLSTESFLNILFLAFAASKAVEQEEKVLLPEFSLASGFYDDPIKLEIKASDPKAIIYYTTDGSVPNENSTIYENPIILKNRSSEENGISNIAGVDPFDNFVPHEKVKKANVIRAIAKLPNSNNNSTVISKTYFVGLNKKELYYDLPVVSLVTDPYNLFDYEHGIYILGKYYDDWVKEDPSNADIIFYLKKGNYNFKGKEGERPATIEYFPGDDSREGFYEDVGIRIMGDVSRTFIQKSFRVVHREEYGPKNLKYDLIPGNMRSDGKGPVEKYKTFNIRNGGNDFKFLIFRDKVVQTLVHDRNFETQQSDMAILYIDGEYWGVYNIAEDYSDHYIANNYDLDKDNIIMIKKHQVEAGREEDLELFDKHINFIIDNDMSIPENYEKASKLFDMDSFAYYASANEYIGNIDSHFTGKNWAMWRVREPVPGVLNADGVWRMMVFDTESCAGIYEDILNYDLLTGFPNAFTPGTGYNESIGAKLLISLLKSKDFKNRFFNAICDVRNIDFDPEVFNPVADALKEKMTPMMHDNFVRFGPEEMLQTEGPDAYYERQYGLFRDWFNGRPSTFLRLISDFFDIKPAVGVTVTSSDFSKGSFKVNTGIKVFEKEFKGDYYPEFVLSLTAVPSEGETFNYWSVENCEFANPDFTPIANTDKLEEITVGIIPSEGCKVTANFGPVDETTTEIPTEDPTDADFNIKEFEIPTEDPTINLNDEDPIDEDPIVEDPIDEDPIVEDPIDEDPIDVIPPKTNTDNKEKPSNNNSVRCNVARIKKVVKKIRKGKN